MLESKKKVGTLTTVVGFELDLAGVNNDLVEVPVDTITKDDVVTEPKEINENTEVSQIVPEKTKLKTVNAKPKNYAANVAVSQDLESDEFFNSDDYKIVTLCTEKSLIDKFSDFCPKLYLKLKLSRRQQTFSYGFHLILKSLEKHYKKSYGNIIPADDFIKEFFTNSRTKSIHHKDVDDITTKAKLTIKLTMSDYELLFDLMNTRFSNFDDKPTRYSVNFFFFEIIRFIENNY